MYIPGWPSLNPAHFLQSSESDALPFPLNAPDSDYFYVARNGIFHLFRWLGFADGSAVLVPDYHHGNEVYAIQASGATIQYYPVTASFDADLDAIGKLCAATKPRALYVTHFVGWPQPMAELKSFCCDRGIILIEDCALSLLSSDGRQALGTYGDYAVFCLYKTLPLPNGGMLVRNNQHFPPQKLDLQPCGPMSVAARSFELFFQWLRMHHETTGRILLSLKRRTGRALKAGGVQRIAVGNTGFDISAVNLDMSGICRTLIRRFNYEQIKQERRRNFKLLEDRLEAAGATMLRKLENGMCPLFFPMLAGDKAKAARALWQRGIDAVEFWNEGDPAARRGRGGYPAQFLRAHVLEIPIHQDLTPKHVEYVADQIIDLGLHREIGAHSTNGSFLPTAGRVE